MSCVSLHCLCLPSLVVIICVTLSILNYPETVRPFHSKGPGHQWHVGVTHDVSEQLGGKHHCYNVGHYGPGSGPGDGTGGWEQVKDGQTCECLCWGTLLHQRPGYDPTLNEKANLAS